LIDPNDEQSLASAMVEIVSDDLLRAQLREKGIAQAKKFTWRDAAEKTLRLYQEAYAICHRPYEI
jgi:glycosyltransferase involved in cell wall biosynthesis